MVQKASSMVWGSADWSIYREEFIAKLVEDVLNGDVSEYPEWIRRAVAYGAIQSDKSIDMSVKNGYRGEIRIRPRRLRWEVRQTNLMGGWDVLVTVRWRWFGRTLARIGQWQMDRADMGCYNVYCKREDS